MTNIAAARPVAGQPIETAWGQEVHDRLEAMSSFQEFFVAAAGTGATFIDATVTFSPPYLAEPAVLWNATASDGKASIGQTVNLGNAAGTVRLSRPDGSTLGAGVTLFVHIVAIGQV